MENWRIRLICLFLFCFSFVIIFRLYYLQIKKGEFYRAQALGQQVSSQAIEGQRGEIFFRDENNFLAQTKKKNLVYIYPKKIPEQDLEKTAELLSLFLNEKKENLLDTFQKNEVFKREISQQGLEQLKNTELKGVQTEELWGRIYPQKESAAHIVGFLNEDGEGQYGIEGYHNDTLKGIEGFQEKGKSPFGYLTSFFTLKKDDFFQGSDLILTLDYNIQYFAEKILKQAKEIWDIDSGQILVSEPLTGKILATAVFPSFNPNKYKEEKDFGIFINPLFQKLFEPGSVFKPITFAAGLEENLISPDTIYEDKGCVELGGPPICNFQKRIWGEQTMTDALEESINTGAIFIEQELGSTLFLEYLGKFGLFEKTNIDLQGEEFSSNQILKNGYARDFAVASFGQGIQITPIQLVQVFGAIANGGNLMRPFVVERIIKPDNEIIEIKPKNEKKILSSNVSAQLVSMLISVVENGSGRRTKIDGYSIAGKTGTAQVPLINEKGYAEDKTIQSFIGFFPALEPRVLIFIKLDNPKNAAMSGHSVVPLFKELAKYIIDNWQIPPSY